MRRLLLLLLFPVATYGQPKKAHIKDLEFLKGVWRLQHAWGDMEEIWGPPIGDNTTCSYRCVKDGKIVFYEFIVIEQSDSVPVMKLRHFNPGSIGREDKNTPYLYPLVALEQNKAVFERPDKKSKLIYERSSPNQLASVLEREKDGKWSKEEFHYQLASLDK
jgi:hypothetical protein